MTDSESDVYRERAHLVAFLAAAYPSAIDDTDDLDYSIVYVVTPTGQKSWHIAVRDLDLFSHVTPRRAGDMRFDYDGHSTAEKYDRLDALTVKTHASVQRWRVPDILGLPYT